MNFEYKHLLPQEFAPSSRVWLYQSNRIFSLSEVLEVEKLLEGFVTQWTAHGAPVKGFGTVFFGQFVVLMADETHTQVSGCSTDSSVRFIKSLEERFAISLFDRQLLAFIIKDKIQVIPLNQLKYSIENEFIEFDTPYFNNTVLTRKDLEEHWIVPAGKSWIGNKYSFNVQANNS